MQVVIKLQSAIFAPNPVQARDKLLDVPGPVPVALLKLILLRIEILLAARLERNVLAELECEFRFEIIYVNDGSRDRTLEYLKALEEIKVVLPLE